MNSSGFKTKAVFVLLTKLPMYQVLMREKQIAAVPSVQSLKSS